MAFKVGTVLRETNRDGVLVRINDSWTWAGTGNKSAFGDDDMKCFVDRGHLTLVSGGWEEPKPEPIILPVGSVVKSDKTGTMWFHTTDGWKLFTKFDHNLGESCVEPDYDWSKDFARGYKRLA